MDQWAGLTIVPVTADRLGDLATVMGNCSTADKCWCAYWYRSNAAIFDASLAYEFYGFTGADAREGLASHREKRAPRFEEE